MVCFCWNSPARSSPTREREEDMMFESAFTYNTDFNYSNNYTNWGKSNTYTKSPEDEEAKLRDLKPNSIVEIVFIGLSFVFLICTLPFSLLFCLKFVNDFERLVVLRLGKVQKLRGPGTYLVLPCIDKAVKVNVDITSFELPNISVITIDKGIAEFSSAVFIKVTNPVISYCNFQDKDMTIKNLSYTSVYKFMARRTLHDITNPQELSRILRNVQEELNKFTADMGVEVCEVTVTKITIHKESENQAISVFKTLMKSDVGNSVFRHLQEQFLPNMNLVKTEAFPAQPPAAPKQENIVPLQNVDQDIEELIHKIRQCCDTNLVNKVQKCYRIICYAEDQTTLCGDFIVDLKGKEGWATWTVHATESLNDVDVSFSLSKQSLLALVKGELSPLTAYMNGLVKITGSVSDAAGLKHLMDRAREVRCI